MKIEEVIENNQNKILFLKAILLGIKYGKSENNNFYEESIINELKKITTNSSYTENLVNNIDTKINKGKILKDINDLENLRINIIKNINNLSYNNYNNNYSKINYLRVQLNNLTKEIDSLNQKLKSL
jgi:hypothetical protein